MTDDHELERRLRDGLNRRAGEVDTGAPVAERARASVRRRHRGRVAAGVAALALATIAVTGVVADRAGHSRKDGGSLITDGVTDGPTSTGWRTERWHDVQVDVPADWGWGTALAAIGARGPGADAYLCGGSGAKITADGKTLVNADPTLPYVGRPIMLSDLCTGGNSVTRPKAPYVWLGAEVEPGTVELDNGFVQETREVKGSTVTVGARDAALRERILDSATGGRTCLSKLDHVPMPRESSGPEKSAGLAPDSLTVCAYSRADVGGLFGSGYELTYAAVLGRPAARDFVSAADAAPRVAGCDHSFAASQLVLLRAEGPGASGHDFREYLVDLDCSQVIDPAGASVDLGHDLERPWGVGGIRVVLGHFIGMLG